MDVSLVPADNREELLAFIKAFYDESGYVFEPSVVNVALDQLTEEPGLGWCFLIAKAGVPIGYVVLSRGFSIEYGGIDSILDEFFVDPAHRGGGIGRHVLRLLDAHCAQNNVRALHLEVERENHRANKIYLDHGFSGNDRALLSKQYE